MQVGSKVIYDSIEVFFYFDFCDDLKKFDILMLVIYGIDDQIVLIDIIGCVMVRLVKGVCLIEYVGGLYGIIDMYKDCFNQDLLDFVWQ